MHKTAHTPPGEWADWVLANIGRTGKARLPVIDAHGRTLRQDAHAQHDLPLWNSSAMDGYAVRSVDTAQATDASPVPLAVTGEVLAGDAADPPIKPGCAVRIMTGAPVPSDADAVVQFELTLDDDAETSTKTGSEVHRTNHARDRGAVWARDTVQLAAPVAPGANVRRRGEDLARGATVARQGDLLTAARLSALAAAGVAEVRVSEMPRVAVLVTGSELRQVGADLARGQIVESNALLLDGLLRECGITAVEVRHCTASMEAVRQALDELAASCDVIVTTGGVGPGSHDLMSRIASIEPGMRAVKLAMRPGKLQCAGTLAAGSWLFALPGNPVSAAVGFELFVRPALLTMQGRAESQRRRVPGVASVGWRGARDRLQVMPVVLDALTGDDLGSERLAITPSLECRPAVNPRGVSHAVGGHGAVQAYAIVGPERGDVGAGEAVELLMVQT